MMNATPIGSSRLAEGPPWVGAATTRAVYDRRWLFVVVMMLLAAVTIFGWRALAQVAVTTGGAGLTWLLLGALRARAGRPGRSRPPAAYMLTVSGLLSLSLPLMLDLWVPLCLGLALGVLVHVAGRGPRLRLNLVALLLMAACFLPAAVFRTELATMREQFGRPADAVLRPNHLILGDAAMAEPPAPRVSALRWTDERGPIDAVRRRDMQMLLSREQARMVEDRGYLVNLLRGNELARMRELFIGVVPGPIGATSPLLMIALGLYLIYRRLASWRTAAAAFAAALATYVLMPMRVTGAIPLFVADSSEAGVVGQHASIVLGALVQLGPAAAVTFLGYLLLATPWCLIVFILAPLADPMSRGGRWVYGLLLGIGLALCQWWLPVPEGAYVALLMVSVLSRPLDALHRSPFVR